MQEELNMRTSSIEERISSKNKYLAMCEEQLKCAIQNSPMRDKENFPFLA